MHQIGWTEWLWQECDPASDAFPQYDIRCMTGHEQHLHAGSPDGCAFREVPSPKHWHHDVGEKEIDHPFMTLGHSKGFASVVSFQNNISAGDQDLSECGDRAKAR